MLGAAVTEEKLYKKAHYHVERLLGAAEPEDKLYPKGELPPAAAAERGRDGGETYKKAHYHHERLQLYKKTDFHHGMLLPPHLLGTANTEEKLYERNARGAPDLLCPHSPIVSWNVCE